MYGKQPRENREHERRTSAIIGRHRWNDEASESRGFKEKEDLYVKRAITPYHPSKILHIAFFKASSESLTALATEADVGDIFSLYNEYFSPDSLDSMPLEMNENIGITFGEPIEGADPGVEIEFGMAYEQLSKNLDFRKGLPFVFNTKRHTSGYTAWDPKFASLFDPKLRAESMEDLRLHWHQLAGVHAIVRMIFTPEPEPSHCTGVLLADEVGLGKTFQACTTIGFLGELAVRQLKKLTLPPIIGK